MVETVVVLLVNMFVKIKKEFFDEIIFNDYYNFKQIVSKETCFSVDILRHFEVRSGMR